MSSRMRAMHDRTHNEIHSNEIDRPPACKVKEVSSGYGWETILSFGVAFNNSTALGILIIPSDI